MTGGSVASSVFVASSGFGPSAGFVSSLVGPTDGLEFFGFFLAASPSSVVGVKSHKNNAGHRRHGYIRWKVPNGSGGEILNANIEPELRGIGEGG